MLDKLGLYLTKMGLEVRVQNNHLIKKVLIREKGVEKKMSFKNLKVPVVIVIITLLAQFIGPFRFDIGIGRIELLPLIYVCIICIFLGPKFLRIVTDEEITWANSKILVSLVFLAAYQGQMSVLKYHFSLKQALP